MDKRRLRELTAGLGIIMAFVAISRCGFLPEGG